MDDVTTYLVLFVGVLVPAGVIGRFARTRVINVFRWTSLTVAYAWILVFGVAMILGVSAAAGNDLRLLGVIVSAIVGFGLYRQIAELRRGEMAAPPSTADRLKQTALEKYSVIYRGGLPEYPEGHSGSIDFLVQPDAFVLLPTIGTKSWFAGRSIPYSQVTSFEIAQRQVSFAEGMLGGLNSRQLNQANNLHIGLRENGLELVLRLEMLSGTTVMAQARRCLELEDRLRVHGILSRLTGRQAVDVTTGGEDPIEQVARLGELRDRGILSTDEFQTKKAELLARL